MSGDFSADRLSATIPPTTDSQRAMATLLLARHDADDLFEMLGLDLTQPEAGRPQDPPRGFHHPRLMHARRLA